MKQLCEVEAAKALMTEAQSWSVMKWLREKKRVRKAADEANAAFDGLSQSLRESWPESLREAYASLVSPQAEAPGKAKISAAIDPLMLLVAKKLKDAEDEAYRARMNAEETFDQAEKKLSTSLAREGCRKAIHCWELKEQAIRKAETVNHTK